MATLESLPANNQKHLTKESVTKEQQQNRFPSNAWHLVSSNVCPSILLGTLTWLQCWIMSTLFFLNIYTRIEEQDNIHKSKEATTTNKAGETKTGNPNSQADNEKPRSEEVPESCNRCTDKKAIIPQKQEDRCELRDMMESYHKESMQKFTELSEKIDKERNQNEAFQKDLTQKVKELQHACEKAFVQQKFLTNTESDKGTNRQRKKPKISKKSPTKAKKISTQQEKGITSDSTNLTELLALLYSLDSTTGRKLLQQIKKLSEKNDKTIAHIVALHKDILNLKKMMEHQAQFRDIIQRFEEMYAKLVNKKEPEKTLQRKMHLQNMQELLRRIHQQICSKSSSVKVKLLAVPTQDEMQLADVNKTENYSSIKLQYTLFIHVALHTREPVQKKSVEFELVQKDVDKIFRQMLELRCKDKPSKTCQILIKAMFSSQPLQPKIPDVTTVTNNSVTLKGKYSERIYSTCNIKGEESVLKADEINQSRTWHTLNDEVLIDTIIHLHLYKSLFPQLTSTLESVHQCILPQRTMLSVSNLNDELTEEGEKMHAKISNTDCGQEVRFVSSETDFEVKTKETNVKCDQMLKITASMSHKAIQTLKELETHCQNDEKEDIKDNLTKSCKSFHEELHEVCDTSLSPHYYLGFASMVHVQRGDRAHILENRSSHLKAQRICSCHGKSKFQREETHLETAYMATSYTVCEPTLKHTFEGIVSSKAYIDEVRHTSVCRVSQMYYLPIDHQSEMSHVKHKSQSLTNVDIDTKQEQNVYQKRGSCNVKISGNPLDEDHGLGLLDGCYTGESVHDKVPKLQTQKLKIPSNVKCLKQSQTRHLVTKEKHQKYHCKYARQFARICKLRNMNQDRANNTFFIKRRGRSQSLPTIKFGRFMTYAFTQTDLPQIEIVEESVSGTSRAHEHRNHGAFECICINHRLLYLRPAIPTAMCNIVPCIGATSYWRLEGSRMNEMLYALNTFGHFMSNLNDEPTESKCTLHDFKMFMGQKHPDRLFQGDKELVEYINTSLMHCLIVHVDASRRHNCPLIFRHIDDSTILHLIREDLVPLVRVVPDIILIEPSKSDAVDFFEFRDLNLPTKGSRNVSDTPLRCINPPTFYITEGLENHASFNEDTDLIAFTELESGDLKFLELENSNLETHESSLEDSNCNDLPLGISDTLNCLENASCFQSIIESGFASGNDQKLLDNIGDFLQTAENIWATRTRPDETSLEASCSNNALMGVSDKINCLENATCFQRIFESGFVSGSDQKQCDDIELLRPVEEVLATSTRSDEDTAMLVLPLDISNDKLNFAENGTYIQSNIDMEFVSDSEQKLLENTEEHVLSQRNLSQSEIMNVASNHSPSRIDAQMIEISIPIREPEENSTNSECQNGKRALDEDECSIIVPNPNDNSHNLSMFSNSSELTYQHNENSDTQANDPGFVSQYDQRREVPVTQKNILECSQVDVSDIRSNPESNSEAESSSEDVVDFALGPEVNANTIVDASHGSSNHSDTGQGQRIYQDEVVTPIVGHFRANNTNSDDLVDEDASSNHLGVQENEPSRDRPTDSRDSEEGAVGYQALQSPANLCRDLLFTLEGEVITVIRSLALTLNMNVDHRRQDRFLRECWKEFLDLCRNIIRLNEASWETSRENNELLTDSHTILLDVGKDCLQICFSQTARQLFHVIEWSNSYLERENSIASILEAVRRQNWSLTELNNLGTGVNHDSPTLAIIGEGLANRAQRDEHLDLFVPSQIDALNFFREDHDNIETNNVSSMREAGVHEPITNTQRTRDLQPRNERQETENPLTNMSDLNIDET